MQHEKSFVAFIAMVMLSVIEMLKSIFKYAPEITFAVQLVIGLLTVIYLLLKIIHFKKRT
jgi:hypothetical protein